METQVEQIAGAAPVSVAPPVTSETQAPAAPVAEAATPGSPAQSAGEGVPPLAPVDTHTEELAAAQARVAELEAKLGETKTLAEQLAEQSKAVEELQGALASQRQHALMAALAPVAPGLRAMYAASIGDVDVTTDAGKAAVQKFLEAHPEGVARTTAGERATIATAEELARLEQGSPLFNKDAYLRVMDGGMR